MNSLLLFLFLGEAVVVFLFFFLSLKAFYDSEKILLDKGCPLESEIKKYTCKKDHKALKICKTTFSTIFFGALIVATGICALAHFDKNAINYLGSSPVAILTGSMSKKNEKNTYLVENNLNTQFNAGSIILLDKMPSKENLKRYDVVGYWTQDNVLIVHRIIDFGTVDGNGNFTSTATTNEATHFIFRGDANASRDSYFVSYDQMYGIYRNYKLDNLGYVVSYVQSYFGLISIIGICSVVFAEDYYSRKTDKAYKEYIAKNIKLLPLKEEVVEEISSSDENTNILIPDSDIKENEELVDENINKEEICNDDVSNNLEEESKLTEESVVEENKDLTSDFDKTELEESESSNLKPEEEVKSKEEISNEEVKENLEETEEKAKELDSDVSEAKEEISSSEFNEAKKEAFDDKEGKNYKAKKLEEKERKKKAFLIKKEESEKKKNAKKTAHRLNR